MNMSTTDEQREAEDAIVELMDEHLWTTGTDVEGKAKCARAILARELASEPAAPVDARDALTANRDAWMAQAQALAQAAGQASFCLRTLVPDDPDAQMTVRMLVAALAALPTAALREPAAPVDARDALIGEINNLAYHGTMYLSERESGNVRLCFADIISKIESHRDSIARQAAAGEKT